MTSEGTVQLISTVDQLTNWCGKGWKFFRHCIEEPWNVESPVNLVIHEGVFWLWHITSTLSMQMAIDLRCWKLPGAKFSLFMGGSGQYAGCPTHDWSVPQRWGVQCWRDRPQGLPDIGELLVTSLTRTYGGKCWKDIQLDGFYNTIYNLGAPLYKTSRYFHTLHWLSAPHNKLDMAQHLLVSLCPLKVCFNNLATNQIEE